MALVEPQQERVVLQVPEGTMLAIKRGAIKAQLQPSQLARQMLLDSPRASGFEICERALEPS